MKKMFYWLFSFILSVLFHSMAWSANTQSANLSSANQRASATAQSANLSSTNQGASTNHRASANQVVEDNLKQDLCDDSAMELALKTIQNTQLEMNKRKGALKIFFNTCQNHKQFLQTVREVALDPQLEWRLKEQALLFHQMHNKNCSNELVTHLLNMFPMPLLWSIRDAMIWVLSETKKGCDQKIIQFFARFIQEPAVRLSSELVDFRQQKIQSLIWALVRLGIKNENLSVVEELKKIAIKQGMNVYFRVRAVEALQDLSFYLESASWTLYEIIKNINKRVPSNEITLTYTQRIQYKKDTEVRDSAFSSLVDLIKKERQELLYFLLVAKEQLPDEELYRRKGFFKLPLPKYNFSASARTALTALIEDKTTQEYLQYALLFINKALPE